jgi:hypothetical protein
LPTVANTTANGLPTDFSVLAGLDELREIDNLTLADTSETAGLRVEPRFNANTGDLRGVAFRERNKERKVVYYVGSRSKGDRKTEFDFYANAYRESRGRSANGFANGGSIGNLVLTGKETRGKSVGTDTNWTHSEGRSGYVH